VKKKLLKNFFISMVLIEVPFSLLLTYRAQIDSHDLTVICKSSRCKKLDRVPSFVNIVYRRSSKTHCVFLWAIYIVYTNVFGAVHYDLNPISFASNFHAILYRKILSTLYHEEPICEKLNLRRFIRIPNIRTHLRNSNNCCSLWLFTNK